MITRYFLYLLPVLLCAVISSVYAEGTGLQEAIDAALQEAPAMVQARRNLRSAGLVQEIQRASVSPQLDFSPPSGSSENFSVQLGDTVPSDAAPETRTTVLSGGGSVTLSQALPSGATVSLSGQNVSTLVIPAEGDSILQQAAEARAAFVQPVFVNGRFIDARLYPAAEQDALLGLHDARLALISAENETVIAVFRAYTALRTAAEERELAALGLQRAEADVRRAELRFDQGSIRFDELLDAEIARDERADEVFVAESALRSAEADFSLLTGLTPGPGDLSMADTDLEKLATGLRAFQEAAGEPVDLQRQQTAFERAQLARILTGAADSGQLQAFVTVRPQYETDREASADFAASFADLYGSSRRPVVAAGISLSVPVFDGGASHLRREQRLLQEEAAARAVAQTAAELYRLRGDVAADRDAAFRRFERASEQIRGAQARVSRAVALLNVGDATEDDVQRAQLDLERRRVELRRGAADYTTAMLRYRSLQGQRVLSVLTAILQE